MFTHSRSEVRALVFAALLLTIIAAILLVALRCGSEESAFAPNDAELRQIRALQKQMQKTEEVSYKATHYHGLADSLFVFDPNHADSLTLLRLGLEPWQIHGMMRYRAKGGRWRSADDFKRLYGLSASDYERIRPYVHIDPADRCRTYVPYERNEYGTPQGERVAYEHIEKYAEGTHVPINEADTNDLKRIPGIGSYYAQKIVAYRERLGGFVSVSQIDEIEGLPSGASRWFEMATNPHPKQIRLNHATFKQLVRHPYLSYEQTKVIINHIRCYGPLHSWRDLRLYAEFTEADFARLTPYFTFD